MSSTYGLILFPSVAAVPALVRSRAFNMAATGSFMPLFSCLLHPTMAAVTYALWWVANLRVTLRAQ